MARNKEELLKYLKSKISKTAYEDVFNLIKDEKKNVLKDLTELKQDIKNLEEARLYFCKLMKDFDISPMEWQDQVSQKMWKLTHRKYKVLES